MFVKRLLPFEFSRARHPRSSGHLVSFAIASPRPGPRLLLRHFVVETNVLGFIARNAGVTEATSAAAQPRAT